MSYEAYSIAISTIAVFLSPLVVLWISRKIEKRREESDRRYQVFKTLMRTRAIRMEPDHVAALNLVDLEFYRDDKVRKAFKEYIQHLGSPMPTVKEEQDRYFEGRYDLFVELMREMGNAIGLTFDKYDLKRHSYAPQGWEDDQSVQRNNTIMISQILKGERPFPISQFMGQQNNPFPEKPVVEDNN